MNAISLTLRVALVSALLGCSTVSIAQVPTLQNPMPPNDPQLCSAVFWERTSAMFALASRFQSEHRGHPTSSWLQTWRDNYPALIKETQAQIRDSKADAKKGCLMLLTMQIQAEDELRVFYGR